MLDLFLVRFFLMLRGWAVFSLKVVTCLLAMCYVVNVKQNAKKL